LPIETSNKAQAGISERPSRDISRYGKSEDRRAKRNSTPSRSNDQLRLDLLKHTNRKHRAALLARRSVETELGA
jgi:hypothetical protein